MNSYIHDKLLLLKAKLMGLRKSLTAWFNALMAFVGFGLPALSDQLPSLSSFLPSTAYSTLFIVTLVGNLILRFKTSAPLEQK